MHIQPAASKSIHLVSNINVAVSHAHKVMQRMGTIQVQRYSSIAGGIQHMLYAQPSSQ